MEIRVLNYFLTIAREKSFSKAAKTLNISQPALSKQIKDLEDEYNIVLFERTTRSLTLTKEGVLFKEKAQEIINLVDRTKQQLKCKEIEVTGDIHMGCSESQCNRIVMKAIAKTQIMYPNIKFHIISGNAQFVMEKIEDGLVDLGIVVNPSNMSKYDYIQLPDYDTLGVLMKKDCPLAKLEYITPNDLKNQPLIISNQEMVKNVLAGWVCGNQRAFNIVATYNLIFNAKLMAEENVGYVLAMDHLIEESPNNNLCFKPLKPQIIVKSNIIWKKYKIFPRHIEVFLQILQDEIN